MSDHLSLIEQTVRRVSISIEDEHILAVVTRAHASHYETLADMHPAMLYSVLRMFKITTDARVVSLRSLRKR